MYLKQTWNQSTTWISSTSSKCLEPSFRAVHSRCNLTRLVQNKNTKFIARTTPTQWSCWKLYDSPIFMRKCYPKAKVVYFLLLAALFFFCHSNTKKKLLTNPKTNANYTQKKSPATHGTSKKFSNYIKSSFCRGPSWKTKNKFSKRKRNYMFVFGLKAFWLKKKTLITFSDFLEIFQAVHLGFLAWTCKAPYINFHKNLSVIIFTTKLCC